MAEDRFARTAARFVAHQDERADGLAARVRRFLGASGDERALDVGCGAGALALALAPLVREVVGVDRVPELLELARERAPRNATFVEADATHLPYSNGEFDLAGTLRTLHHVTRPELVLAELARVTRPGGRVLVIDQLAPVDPLDAFAVDRFERARDPGHARLLPEIDLRHFFEANGLVLLRDRRDEERREARAVLRPAGVGGRGPGRALR